MKHVGEQVGRCRHLSGRRSSAAKRHHKRASAKRVRQLARLHPEDAPRKYRYTGWAD